MHLAEIWRYPAKSMAGERLEDAALGPLGIPGDRELVVVDGTRIVTARTHPGLLRMRAARDPDGGVRVDGLDWRDPAVAHKVRAAAGPDARLVRLAGAEHFDILPLLVTSDGAIAALGVDPRRLRPNLVLGGVPGLEERNWEGRFIAIGDAVIGLADLRQRCIMTTWDPETGVQDLRVFQRIRSEFGGRFALNAWVARSGRIAVGAAATLLDGFDEMEPPLQGRFVRG
jgi:MOSC domain-containing protein